MIVRSVILLIVVFCVFITFVRALPPQSTNAETRSAAATITTTSTGEEQTMTRSYRPSITRDGEPYLHIQVYRRPDGTLTAVPERRPTSSERNNTPPNLIPADCVPQNSKRCKRDRDIVFPDEVNRTINIHCDGNGRNTDDTKYCLEVDDYPESVIANNLRNDLSKYETFFGVDQMPNELTQRFNGQDKSNEKELCYSEKKVIFPKKGVTINEDWKYIIQTADGKQGVLVEVCVGSENPCEYSSSLTPNGYAAVCKQHYVYRRMLSSSPNGDAFTADYFQMPSCCKCVFQRT